MCALLMILDSTPVVGAAPGPAPGVCAGCPVEAEVDQAIVDFAVSELQGSDGKCARTKLQVENFQSQVGIFSVFPTLYCVSCSLQVVAGMLYKFDLVLQHKNEGDASCSKDDGEEERCHVEVYDVPWLQQREITDNTNCSRN